MFGSKSSEISKLEAALKNAEDAHDQLYDEPFSISQITKTTNSLKKSDETDENATSSGESVKFEKVIHTYIDEDEIFEERFNDEGKIIEELITFIILMKMMEQKQ